MDKDFYTNDFEQLLRERTEEFKMYPSESVWSNIFNKLHPGRRWGIIGGSMLLLLFTATVLVFRTNNKNAAITPDNAENTKPSASTAAVTTNGTEEDHSTTSVLIANKKTVDNKSLNRTIKASATNRQFNPSGNASDISYVDNGFISKNDNLIARNAAVAVFTKGEETNSGLPFEITNENSVTLGFTKGASKLSSTENSLSKPVVKGYYNTLPKYNTPKTGKLEWQLYFTPSVSYRALFRNDNPANRYFAYNNLVPGGSLDSKVHHSPALGFEIGNTFMYALTKSMRVKARVQFNYSKYNINAYTTNPEPATIRLANSNLRTETISVTSSLKTSGSYYNATTIASQNTALSFPVGADLKLLGNSRVSWGIGGSVQPTIILNNKAYIVTNDLKNYVNNADVFRSFLMNSALETYVRIEKGNGVALQVGPQLRYQISSSYSSKYTISEHLIEYGIKVGIIKRLSK